MGVGVGAFPSPFPSPFSTPSFVIEIPVPATKFPTRVMIRKVSVEY